MQLLTAAYARRQYFDTSDTTNAHAHALAVRNTRILSSVYDTGHDERTI